MRKSFWQYQLDCFAPKGFNTRQVDTKTSFFVCILVAVLF